MNRYRIKFKSLIKQTEKAVCLERWENGIVWLPLKCIREDITYTKGVCYIIPQWLCEEKDLNGKLYKPYHTPKHIEPKYNQEAIDELKI